jgi:hypothetical protein
MSAGQAGQMRKAAPTQVKKITFSALWANYSSESPCVGKDDKPPPGWQNQCAVRVGLAMERSGVSFKSFSSGRCPTGPQSGGMVGSAQALANWLKTRPFPGCPAVKVIKPSNWMNEVRGKTGIIFFKDYWRRKGEVTGVGSGDHIDLWNRDTLTRSLVSFLRFTIGISRFPNLNPWSRAADNENWFSDLGRSSEIWFWEIP